MAVAAYLPGIHWGLPLASTAERVRLWAFDDISPLPALTETYHTFVSPAPDRWLAYPLLHHFLLTATYSPYLGWLALTGRFSNPSAIFPYGFEDPVTAFQVLTLLARAVSVLMAAGIVVAVYRIGHILWDRRTGVLSAMVVLAVYPMFSYSKTACLDIPYVFWTSLGLLTYARILTAGSDAKRAAALGAFAALAAATKDQAAGVFLLVPLALAPIHLRDWRAGRVSAWGPPAALAGVGAIVYALASGLVFDPDRHLAHLRWISRPDGMLSEPFVSWYPQTLLYPQTFAGKVQQIGAVLRSQVQFLGPVFAALAALALLDALRRDRWKLALVLPIAGYVFTFLLSIHWFCLRYGMPVMLVTALFAGRGLSLAWDLRKGAIPIAVSAGVLAFAWPVDRSLELVRHMFGETRLQAERWLAAEMPEGARIAAAHHVNALPRLRRDVGILELPVGEAARRTLQQEAPEFVSVIPDWTSNPGTGFSRAYPEELFRALEDGSLGYRRVAAFDSGFWSSKPLLDYPTVSPPVRLYRRIDSHDARGEMAGPFPPPHDSVGH